MTRMKHFIYNSWACFVVLVTMLLLFPLRVNAEDNTYYPPINCYENENNSSYEDSKQYLTDEFCFGKNSIGKFFISGSINKESVFDGYQAYAAKGTLTIGYTYDGSYKTKVKEDWNLISDSEKSVDGISTKKKINKGAIIIQKSTDGSTWVNAIDPIVDCFDQKKLDYSKLYTVSDSDLKAGSYFRVIIAYKMGRKTGETSWSLNPPSFPEDIYDYKYCMEVYKFYACYGVSTVELRELMTGNNIKSGDSVVSGFVIDKNGSSDVVTVKKNNSTENEIETLTTISESGVYTITVKTDLGQNYVYTITVTDGLKQTSLLPTVYENEKKKEYTTENPLSGNTSFGIKAHTELSISQKSGTPITVSSRNGDPAYGITGDNVSLFLKLTNSKELSDAGWEIASDTWGKKISQTIEGVETGQVDTGAIVIQTSSDGVNWENEDMSRYAKGLYTTDYENNYGHRGDVFIYAPNGQNVLNGQYIRILYAYEIKKDKEDYRCLEEYKFYLCSNELDAVAFHNLSADDKMDQILEDYDDVTASIYRQAETMLTEAYTVSGFSIDTSLNPTVTYTVQRNDKNIAVPSSHKFTDEGKYVINLTSAVNSKRTVEIYVDRMTDERALEYYFGESFLTGKRIYSEGDYPVYEGELTSYGLKEIDSNHLPLSGQIKNTSTGEVINIAATRDGKSGSLNSPGEYEATFTTNANFESDTASGDCRTFTFHFSIIAKGTAPGPVVNQQSLENYAKTTISDSYPLYYALTYQSAGKGNITLAFSTKEEALNYAYEYEKGMVEQQSDGTFRYTGSFLVSQKEKYDSAWDLTDAVNYFAEQAIRIQFFDLSDDFTTLSLDDSVIESTGNLRTLELGRSVTIFAEAQKEKLTDLEALPFINNKPYSYLTPGQSGRVSSGFTDFEFIKDKYGCDSDSVVITDVNGKEYPIRYEESVENQLKVLNCPSGVVTINEQTVYGDSNSYKAVYINEGENTATIELSLYRDGNEEKQAFKQSNNGTHIETEAFSIASIQDELDPYSLIIVSDEKNDYAYAADQLTKDAWSDPGEYEIKVVNRLGYSFTIYLTVTESDYATLMFSGEGTEDTQFILATYGEQNVQLPKIERYGYNLVGYEDDDGNVYSDEIATIMFRGTVMLNAVWQAKQFTVTLQDPDGNTLNTLVMDYGKEYDLPTPELPEGFRFTGWSLNGTKLESNVITLQSEGDITLVAEGVGKSPVEDTSSTQESQENKLPIPLIIVVVLALIVVLVGTISLGHRKKVSFRKRQEEKETESGIKPVVSGQKENEDDEA